MKERINLHYDDPRMEVVQRSSDEAVWITVVAQSQRIRGGRSLGRLDHRSRGVAENIGSEEVRPLGSEVNGMREMA
jgi:hypothetical protein